MDVYLACAFALAVLVGTLVALLVDCRARERAWRQIAAERRHDHEAGATGRGWRG